MSVLEPHQFKGAAGVRVPITPQRQRLLEAGHDRLTDIEVADGWHFCPDWDFMLIHPLDKEAECCTCKYNHPFQ